MAGLPTQDDIAFYEEHGYWVGPTMFDEARVAEIREAVKRAYAGKLEGMGAWQFLPPVNADRPGAVKTALFSWCVNDVIREVVFDPAITAIAAAFMKTPKVRVWQDQAIWKPGAPDGIVGDDGNIGYHQDYSYWQDSSTTNMVSANIALQDTTVLNGALCVFDGSHKLGLHDEGDGFFQPDLKKRRRQIDGQIDLGKEVVLNLKAGQVSFHHALTFHYSGPNRFDTSRMVIAPAYMPDGTYYREEGQPETPHSEFLGPDRTHGTLYAGDHFPLVYEA